MVVCVGLPSRYSALQKGMNRPVWPTFGPSAAWPSSCTRTPITSSVSDTRGEMNTLARPSDASTPCQHCPMTLFFRASAPRDGKPHETRSDPGSVKPFRSNTERRRSTAAASQSSRNSSAAGAGACTIGASSGSGAASGEMGTPRVAASASRSGSVLAGCMAHLDKDQPFHGPDMPLAGTHERGGQHRLAVDGHAYENLAFVHLRIVVLVQ